MNELDIFSAALELRSSEERNRYFDEACGNDLELRQRVEELLGAHAQAGSFIGAPAPDRTAQATTDGPIRESAGAQIGAYKLIEQIGEGGMGTVWMAQQTEPVKRLVALKVIKAGMDSKQVLARFDAERQALALMDHPNIARIFDGGVTDSRPYFVMELVKGVPITKYCDEHHLTPRQRLELFIPVCHAIQHAHQKGIIHRDLKPSNVLVAQYDGRPVPKVIDFGVAKAAGQSLTDKTLVTGFGNVVGTLEYMSPEQAEINQLDIDTRSDIYSLGVLLYELLAGSPPFSRKDLEKAGMLEMLRVIREDEPSKPSTKLSSSDALPSLSANRGTEPAKLTKIVRGELDWIVMKALEKDRNRRYETANGFAMDVHRYLADEAVLACPPSVRYRLRKFARRYKKVVTTASAFLLLLVLGVVVSTWQAVLATQAQGEARTAEEKAKIESAINLAVITFMQEDLLGQMDLDAQAEPNMQPDRDVKVRTLLDRAAASVEERFREQPLVEAAVRLTIGNAYRSLGEYLKARPQLERALEIRRRELGVEHPDTLAAMNSLARLYVSIKSTEMTKAEALLLEALDNSQRVLGSEHPITLTSRHYLASVYVDGQRFVEAEPLIVETLEVRRRLLGPDHLDTLRTQHNLALMYQRQRQFDKAEALSVETLQGCRRALAAEHPMTLSCLNNLGAVYLQKRQYAKAEPLFAQALDVSRRVLGTGNDTTRFLMKNLAEVYMAQGQYAKAEPLIVESVNILFAVKPAERRGPISFALSNLNALFEGQRGLNLLNQKKYAEAEPILRLQVTTVSTRNRWFQRHTLSLLGACLAGQQKYAEAEPLLLAGYKGLRASEAIIPMADRKLLAGALERIVQLYEAWSKPEQAAEWRKKLDQEKQLQPRRDDALANFNRGTTLAKEGEHAEAEAAFREAVRLEPAYPEAHFGLGMACSRQGRPAEAEAAVAEAARLKPLAFSGSALSQDGKAAEAEVAYKAALRSPNEANRAENYTGLGRALEKQGKWEEAIGAFEQAVQFKPEPEVPFAHVALAKLCAMCPEVKYRNVPRAVEAAKKAVELAPQYFWTWQTLGWVRYRAGDWKACIEALEKSNTSTKVKRADSFEWFFVAMAHWQLGNKEEARNWYDRAVKWMEMNQPQNEQLRRFRDEAAQLIGVEKKQD